MRFVLHSLIIYNAKTADGIQLRCEVDDLNLGLDHFYGDFDVVHARLIASGVRNSYRAHAYVTHLAMQVKDYRGLIDQISRVLRPGGVLILLDTDFLVADVNYHTQVPNTSLMQPPWLQRFLAFVNMAIKKRGGNIEACEHMHEWLAEHPAYEQIEWKDHFMGISPWMQGRSSESQRQRHIAQQMRADLYVSPSQSSLSSETLNMIAGVPKIREAIATRKWDARGAV
jgi:SAM-dependent methyltransferase